MSNKLKYQVCNWSEYNQSLIARGRLSLWIDEKVISEWLCTNQTTTGKFTQIYSDVCIECGIRLKAMYGLPWRAVQGFLQSIMAILEVDLPVPNYSTFCRRQQSLIAALEKETSEKNMVLAIDSTGLKVFTVLLSRIATGQKQGDQEKKQPCFLSQFALKEDGFSS